MAAPRQHGRRRRNGRSLPPRRIAAFELLEERHLLAVDWGDAPDTGPGTGPGNYNTLSTDNGPSHTIIASLRLGANVDGDGGALQNAAANADDVNGALPDDEDGVSNPAADLVLTVGTAPRIGLRVTNTTGISATLYGWIDYNNNGVFENATERSSITIPNGTNNLVRTILLPTIPSGFTGTTYARFRLSTDPAAANPVGAAADGEVEDYRVRITKPGDVVADSAKTKKFASGTSGAPTLANSDYFGRSVTAIGDIDGDGVTDLAVGANGDDTGGPGRGAVHVFLMNANGTIKSTVKLQPFFTHFIANGDYFGSSVASIGDLNGDGVNDLVVGAERHDEGGTNRGAVHVLFMNANGTSNGGSSTIIRNSSIGLPLANNDYFGRSVASLGDLDGDGIPDLAVGAYGDDTGGANRGAVHVLFMNANGTVKSTQKIAHATGGGPALANSDFFGSSIASIRDLDGDGISELAVGAVGDDTGGANRGAVHILYMNANGTVKNSQKIASGTGGGPVLTNDDQFGRSVAALGDIDGDGVIDLAVGSYYDDTGGNARGALHVLLLNVNGTVKSSQKIASGTGGGPTLANDDRFGAAVSALGDFDGDGALDLLVGANFDDTGGTNRGAVYMLSLKGIVNTNPIITSPNTANVPENTTSVMTVTATDSDLPPQIISFSIVGGADQSKFSISVGGNLSFVSAPDFEAPTDANGDNVYVVTVQASDSAGGTAQQTISVNITPVNDNIPIFTSTNTAIVPENTTFVKTVTATDADFPLQTITFSIVGGADQSKFSITPGGALSFISAPDFEVPTDANGDNTYIVVVQANDGAGGTNQQAINVTVGPVNDNDPVITSTNSVSVQENMTFVMTVTATDADLPGSKHYSLPGPGSATVTYTIDATTPGQFTVYAQASLGDNGGISSYGLPLTGPILTIDHRAPYGVSSANLAPAGFSNLRSVDGNASLTAAQPLIGPAANFLYGIGQVSNSFAALGIPIAGSPDPSSDSTWTVPIVLAQGTYASSGIIDVLVGVDLLANLFAQAGNSADRISAGVIVHIFYDQPITFSIVGGADQSKFAITPSGVLSFLTAPDYDAPTDANGDNVYLVTVQANDGQGRTTTQTISVTVTPAPADYGDAPDSSAGTGPGNYNTRLADGGPRHDINPAVRMGANVDADSGTLQNAAANADDVNAALPDDEDGLVNPAADLVLTVGMQPTVDVRVTNTSGSTATLYGWIDYNANGVFDNATERASVSVPSGTSNAVKTLVFPTVPAGFSGTTYARFRLSTDAAAANPVGGASNGEVEDYRVSILKQSTGLADAPKTRKIASGTNGLSPAALANGDKFGGAVTAVGDLDGDGIVDIAVGAPSEFGSSTAGTVHILLLNANGTVKSQQTIGSGIGGGPTMAIGDYFGHAVTSLGDLDGDGVPDLAVAASKDDTGGYIAGAVHVLLMNPGGTVKSSQKIASGVGGGPTLAALERFGTGLTAVGDLDGDGVTDLAVGAVGNTTAGVTGGAVYVLFMNANGTVKSSQKIAHNTGGGPALANFDGFGSSATSMGDLDGDGVSDLAVGAIGDDTGGSNRGAVHVLFMNANGTVKSHQKISSGAGGPVLLDGDGFGRSVASLGDLDGDGVADLAVGAYQDDTGGLGRGGVHVLLLHSNGAVKVSQKIAQGVGGGPTLANYDNFGSSLATLGDLDGDGIREIVVGAERDDTGGNSRGAVYVLYLKAGLFFGDYNLNGTVDAADYVAWRNSIGTVVTPFAGADGSGNGVIDEADRLIWLANFGRTAPPAGSGAAEMPAEPAAIRAPATPSATRAPAPQPALAAAATARPAASDAAAPVESVAAPTNRLAETVAKVVERSSAPAGLFFEVTVAERERSAAPRIGLLPATVASYDQALLAWLTSRPVATCDHSAQLDGRRADRESDRREASADLGDVFDRALAAYWDE